ncbi:hypothetical protein GU926_01930 [Nibribacter ruber]|uniref:MarR family transcriptional regulator n=1 Tax=Nibribacter ruber TaxID=2698458 RepID=A0A6P1NVH2_9BACT|nr:MarR family transcriptional regulator [Nibribacter ruber]QHL86269.1 hypothetical protein GU926_01930 [Nibribacter ruber]
MSKQAFLEGISGLLSAYGASVGVRTVTGLSTHQLRVLLAIHYLNEMHLNRVTKIKVAKCTYLWLSSVSNTVNQFVEAGYIKPLEKPMYYLHLT